jgi:GntP family gluconate:H+ symporter
MSTISVPIIGLTIAVFILILLVLWTKVHPVIAMIIAACIAGVTGGLSMKETIDAITHGFGSTLGTIGIVIGLGVMMGRILEVSGAAEQIAYSFIKWLGPRKEEWSLAATGYLVSIPIFADSAFVILYPIAKALSKKGGRSIFTTTVALAGGLIVTHTMVPPTPGPLGVAGIFGADIGAMMLLGLALGIPCLLAFVLYAQWLAKKYPAFVSSIADDEMTSVEPLLEKKLPSLTLSLLPIVVPIILILIKALVSLFPLADEAANPAGYWFVQVFDFIGTPIIALCISTLLAVYTLVPGLDKQQTSARLEEGLQSAGIILLVTGAGGALGFVVRESGVGTQLAGQITNLPFSPVMIPFFVASVMRLIQGSATVAMITSASITAPILAEIPDVNMLFAAQGAAIGGFLFSYFNDSLFWVVGKLIGISDVKVHITVWSVPTILSWAVGGILIALLNLFFGSRGSLLDLLVPVIGLGIVFWVVRKK